MKLYHYTTGHKLAAIAAAGHLIPSPAPARFPDERGVLWFSANEEWEPTATKPIATHPGQAPIRSLPALMAAVGLFRFVWQADTAEPQMMPMKWRMTRWPFIALDANISADERQRMGTAGRMMGAQPTDWYGRVDPLEIDDLGFEVMAADGSWHPADMAQAIAMFEGRGLTVLSAVVA